MTNHDQARENFRTLLEELKSVVENKEKANAKFDVFVEQLRKYQNQITLIAELETRQCIDLILAALLLHKPIDLTKSHIQLLEEVIEEAFADRSVYKKIRIDKKIFQDPQKRFTPAILSPEPLYTVRTDLKCNQCGRVGAVRYQGNFYPRIEKMDYAAGFGGTLPYQCTNCENFGLDEVPLEGYGVTFTKIEKEK